MYHPAVVQYLKSFWVVNMHIMGVTLDTKLKPLAVEFPYSFGLEVTFWLAKFGRLREAGDVGALEAHSHRLFIVMSKSM
jgi:hypothetical protein